MYNPYGNQRQSQGQYGANANPDRDPRMGTTNMGLPFNPPGASGAANPLSGVPMFSQPMSYRPELNRADVDIDFQLSRAREEARLLNAPLSQPSTQPPSQMIPQREDIYSPFSTYSAPSGPSSSYSAPSSSDSGQPSRASDTDSGVGSSLSWLLNLTRSSSAEPRPFVSSSSSSSFQGGGDSQSNRSESVIPGLGDYQDRKTPPPHQRKDSAPAKYSAETAANILRHFNLEKEDLEQLISYPEDEITPDSLPIILRQIRLEKSRKSAAMSSSYKNSMGADSHQEPKQNRVTDYAMKDMPASVSTCSMNYNMDRALQNTTSRDYAKDIPLFPSKCQLEEEKSPILQPSKVIEYGHTGKYMGGAGGSDSMGTIARAIQGIMKIDTGFRREPLQPTCTATSSMPAKPNTSLPPSQSTAAPAGSFSSLFSSTLTSASSDLTKKAPETQAPMMAKPFSIPKQDTDFRQRKPEVFTDKVENVKPLSKLSLPKTTKKTGVVLVDSIKKPKDEGKKQDMPGLQGKAGQPPNVGNSSTFVPRNVHLTFPPKANPIPTLSSNATGRPTIIPPAKPVPAVVSKTVGPVMMQPKPQPKPAQAPLKASTAVKGLPTSAMMQDYAAASPRSFPHTCCLCHKECTNMKDWISHQNSPLHIEKCKFLRLIYPEWNGEVTARDPKPASASTQPPPLLGLPLPLLGLRAKTRKSRSRSSSPRRRDKRRSRSRSAHRLTRREPKPASASTQPTPLLGQPPKTRKSRSRSSSPRRKDKRRSRSRSAHRLTRRSRSVSPPSSSRRPRTRSQSRERRVSSPRRTEERRRRQSPKRSDSKRASPKRSDERCVSPRLRTKASPGRSRERRYSPLRYSPPGYTGSRYSPTRYSPPGGHDRESLSPQRDRGEHSRSRRETRSASDKSSSHKSAPQRKKQSSLEEMTKHALESSSALKSLAHTTDLPALAEMLVPVIMSQMKKMNPSAAPSTGAKKKVVKKPTATTVKKTTSTAAKHPAVKPSTMVRLGSIIAPLSHDDIVAFAEQFGKTKSVLLFRQKHQAVVCFEKEEDAKKLRNAKDIQIKEHPVTIVRYKEAVSTTQRKSPVSVLKKPLKSVVKTTTTGKTAPRSAAAKPTAPTRSTPTRSTPTRSTPTRSTPTRSTPTRSTPAVKKTSETGTPEVGPKMAQEAQESKTDTNAKANATNTTASATVSARATVAPVVVTKDRKVSYIQNTRTIQHSSLKEVQIQDDAKNTGAKQDDYSEVSEIKDVCMEAIGIDRDEEEPEVNKMVVTTRFDVLTDVEEMGAEAVTEEKTPNVESDKNDKNLKSDDFKMFEPNDSEKVETKLVTEKHIPREENLKKDDLKISEETIEQDQELMEKDGSLTQKVDEKPEAEPSPQKEQEMENTEPSTGADVEMEQAETILSQEGKPVQEKPSAESYCVKKVAVTSVQPQEGAAEQNKAKSIEKQTEEPSKEMEGLTTDVDPNPAPLTLGENLDKLLTVSALETFKLKTVFSPKFRQNGRRLVLLSNLPEFNPEEPYTEEHLEQQLRPFGFNKQKNNMYILPQCKMAFVEMPTKFNVQELMMSFVKFPDGKSMFRGSQLQAHVVCKPVNMSPMPFYIFLMRECFKNISPDDGVKTVYITNICQSEMEELQKVIRKIGFIKNFVPLLNKAFVEFESKQAADAFGIYHSFLKRTGSYGIFRMMIPQGRGGFLSHQMEAKVMPDPSDCVPGVVFPVAIFRAPSGTQGPFWVTMTTVPYFYPTQSLWFLIPEYETLQRMPLKQMKLLSPWPKTEVMLTGLPASGYTHHDVARLVWHHLRVQNLHCLYYNVIVLPLQRRAFINFSHQKNCDRFRVGYFSKKMSLNRNQLHAHYVQDKLFPLSNEEEMYCRFMKLSNAGTPCSSLLEQRLLSVFVSEVSFDVIRLVIEIVTSVSPILGYLPLANRICIEMADSNDVPKVKEKFSSYKPEPWKTSIWFKVVALKTCSELKQTIKNAGRTVVHLNPSGPKPEETEETKGEEEAEEKTEETRGEEEAEETSGEEEAEEEAEETRGEEETEEEAEETRGEEEAEEKAEETRGEEEAEETRAEAEPEKQKTGENYQKDSSDSSSSAPPKEQDPHLPRIDEDMLRVLTAAIREHRRHKQQSSDSEQDDRKSQTSEDSSTRCGSSRDFPFEDLSDFVMVDEISEETEHLSSSHHHHSSSSSTRRPSDSRRDREKPSSSSSDRYHTSTKQSSSTSSASRRRDGFKSPSTCSSNSSSPRKAHESSKSRSSSRSSTSHEKHSGRSDKYKKESEALKSDHKGVAKSSKEEKGKPQQCSVVVELNKETIRDLKEVSSEGYEIIDAVDDQNCANEMNEDANQIPEAFEVVDSVDDELKTQEEGVEFEESTNQEVDTPQSMDSKPEMRSKRKREGDHDGHVCLKITRTGDEEGTKEMFEILDSTEDQAILEEPQNDDTFIENAEFQVIDEAEDRPKSNSECQMSESSSSRLTRSGRQTRSEEKEKSAKRNERTARKLDTRCKHESSSSKIYEEIVEEFKVIDAVEEEPTQDQEKVTIRRTTRGRRDDKQQKCEGLDSVEDNSTKLGVSTRERRSRSVKIDSSKDEKTHKDDSKPKAIDSQERDEHKKTTKAGKDNSTDLEQGTFEILDSVEDTATVSEKLKSSKTDSGLNEKSPKNEPLKSQERSEIKAVAKNKNGRSTSLEKGAFENLDKETPSQSQQSPAKETQETKRDGAEETYRSTRQTRSSQRDQSTDSSLKRSTPTKSGRTPTRETKKSDTKSLPQVEVQEAIKEEFQILDAVEEEPAPPSKVKRGRPRKQPRKAALNSEEKIKSPMMEESMVKERDYEKQDESETAMEISEEKGVEEDEEEPVYEVIDSLEEEQTAFVEYNVEKPMEEVSHHDSNYTDNLAVKDDDTDEMEGHKKPVEGSPSRTEEKNKQLAMEETEQSGNLNDSQELENKLINEAAILEAEKIERSSTRTTRSTKRACPREERSPKQRTSRKSDTKQECVLKDEQKNAENVEAKSENPESVKLDEVVDEKYCVLDSVEDEEEDGERAPQAAARRRGRPRKQPRKSALKSGDVEPKCLAFEEVKESCIEEDKMEDVSQKQKLEKSEKSLDEIDRNEEDEEPIYEVLDVVEEDQEEDLVQKEQDILAYRISQEVETREKGKVEDVKDRLDQKSAEVGNVELQKLNLETPEGIEKNNLDEQNGNEAKQEKPPTSPKETVEDVQCVEKDGQDTSLETRSEFSRKGQSRVLKPSVHDGTGKILKFETAQTCKTTALEKSTVQTVDEMPQKLADLISIEGQKVDMNLDAVSDEEDFPEYTTEEEDGLVILDEIMEEENEETEPRIEDEGQNKERVETGVDGEKLKAEGVELEQKGEGLKTKEEETVKEGEEINEEGVQKPRQLTQEDQSEPAKAETRKTPHEAVRETPHTDLSKSIRREHEEEEGEVSNFVTLDEVGEDEMEEPTPKGRGLRRRRGRKTPVRKSTHDRKVAPRDSELEEGQTESVESEVLPRSNADSGEMEETAPSLELQPETESKAEGTPGRPLEMGVETDVETDVETAWRRAWRRASELAVKGRVLWRTCTQNAVDLSPLLFHQTQNYLRSDPTTPSVRTMWCQSPVISVTCAPCFI
ncbi:hypothetical protein NQD34_013928 [Periophthalmus magnuspinnatus]|nr:hypothetical protein NQD34_013928 [Periophthalmus magnuspinnatus]